MINRLGLSQGLLCELRVKGTNWGASISFINKEVESFPTYNPFSHVWSFGVCFETILEVSLSSLSLLSSLFSLLSSLSSLLLDDVNVQIIYGNNTHSLNGLFFFPSFYSLLLLLCDRITFSKCTLLRLRPPLLPIH